MSMLRRCYTEMSDAELGDAILEARVLAPSADAARTRLGELAAEAVRRLAHPAAARRAARRAYWRAAGHRGFIVFWWLHVLGAGFLGVVALEEAQRRSGEPLAPLAIAVAITGGLAVLRWTLTGRWRFGPEL